MAQFKYLVFFLVVCMTVSLSLQGRRKGGKKREQRLQLTRDASGAASDPKFAKNPVWGGWPTCPDDLMPSPGAEEGATGSDCDMFEDECNAGLKCCRTKFEGPHGLCTDSDECSSGEDNCDADATCTNTDGSFSCSCNDGFVGNGTSCRGCPDNYYLNPVTETCFRLVIRDVRWSEAKFICELAGESLITFPSLEAMQWFDNFKETTALPGYWTVEELWIGLAVENGSWKWQGLDDGTVSDSDDRWGSGEPDKTDGTSCGFVDVDNNFEKGVYEEGCTQTNYLLCEKLA